MIKPRLILGLLLIGGLMACRPPEARDTSAELAADSLTEAQVEIPAQQPPSFPIALKSLENLSYELKALDTLSAEENFLSQRLSQLARFERYQDQPRFPDSLVSALTFCQRAQLKSTRAVGDRLYPRATIEYWLFSDSLLAKAAMGVIGTIREAYGWDMVSKSPITYGRRGRQLYFITPGGFYMLDEVPPLEKSLIQALSQ